MRMRIAAAAGAALVAAVVVGGVAFAQSPDPSPGGQPSDTPATRDKGDCPDKGGEGGAGARSTPSTQSTPRF